MAACFGLPVDIIGPAGFDLSDRALRRAGLDYLKHAVINTHQSWRSFELWRQETGKRLVLLSTHANCTHADFCFDANDILLMGRETSGVPDKVRETANACVKIPIRRDMRSLNLAMATGIAISEALRQTNGFPV